MIPFKIMLRKRVVEVRHSASARNAGYSAVELIIVVAIIGIMCAVALPYVFSYRSRYKSEEQSIKIMDLMREAGQTALNQRRTIRFEIDITDNAILLIDESTDPEDTLLKRIPIEPSGVLRMDVNPTGVTRPNPPNYNTASFDVDGVGHRAGAQPVIGHTVWAIRFRSDGSVVNAGNIPISATLFVFPPAGGMSEASADNKQVRAITMYGGSGAVRYWKYDGTKFTTN